MASTPTEPPSWAVFMLCVAAGCDSDPAPPPADPAPPANAPSAAGVPGTAPSAEPADDEAEAEASHSEHEPPPRRRRRREGDGSWSAVVHTCTLVTQSRETLASTELPARERSPAARARRADELCREALDGVDECPPGIEQIYAEEYGVLAVQAIFDTTISVSSHRSHALACERAADSGGDISSLDGIDVAALQLEQFVPSRDLIVLLRRADPSAGADGSHECAMSAVTRVDPTETWEKSATGYAESSFAEACVDAVRRLCDRAECELRVESFEGLSTRRLVHHPPEETLAPRRIQF